MQIFAPFMPQKRTFPLSLPEKKIGSLFLFTQHQKKTFMIHSNLPLQIGTSAEILRHFILTAEPRKNWIVHASLITGFHLCKMHHNSVHASKFIRQHKSPWITLGQGCVLRTQLNFVLLEVIQAQLFVITGYVYLQHAPWTWWKDPIWLGSMRDSPPKMQRNHLSSWNHRSAYLYNFSLWGKGKSTVYTLSSRRDNQTRKSCNSWKGLE